MKKLTLSVLLLSVVSTNALAASPQCDQAIQHAVSSASSYETLNVKQDMRIKLIGKTGENPYSNSDVLFHGLELRDSKRELKTAVAEAKAVCK